MKGSFVFLYNIYNNANSTKILNNLYLLVFYYLFNKNCSLLFSGEMCIHLAASGNHVELVRLLLRLGADLDAREGLAGRTALHLAIEHGCKGVLKFLLEECRPSLDVPNYAGYTAYQIALCVDTQLALDLVRFGARPQPLSDEETDSDNSSMEDNDDSYMFNLSPLQNSPMSAVRA